MTPRRWMKTLLEEAKKPENEIKPIWSRDIRPKRCLAQTEEVSAAE